MPQQSVRGLLMPAPIQFNNWPSNLAPGYGPYRAVIERVVDGDTAYALISLGMEVYAYHSIRIFGIDSPELYTSDPVEREKGRAARAYLESICPPGAKCLLRTDKDKTTFGRYVASLLLSDGRDVASEMVRAGHAEWSGG